MKSSCPFLDKPLLPHASPPFTVCLLVCLSISLSLLTHSKHHQLITILFAVFTAYMGFCYGVPLDEDPWGLNGPMNGVTDHGTAWKGR
jgi:hypothetical protein